MSRGKTWVYWYDRISTEIRKLYPDRFDSVGMVPWHLSPEERDQVLLKCQNIAELHCKYFSERLVWPELTPDERCAIYFRLEHALNLVEVFTCVFSNRTRVVVRPPDLQITREPEVWNFLLIDWWRSEYIKAKARQNNEKGMATDCNPGANLANLKGLSGDGEVSEVKVNPCIPELTLVSTVLGLCEASYRSHNGCFYGTISFFDLLPPTRWELIVACLNAKIGNNATLFDDVLREYAPLLIKPLTFDVEVKSIFGMCKNKGLPIVAQVAAAEEKCLVIATCHDPWIPWFKSIFGDYEEAEMLSVNEELKPVIGRLLDDLDRKSSKQRGKSS